MALHHQAVHTEVHGLLAQGSDEVAPAADVAGVVYHGQVGQTAVQLDGNLPHGHVAVQFLLITGKATVYRTQALNAGTVQTLQGTYP